MNESGEPNTIIGCLKVEERQSSESEGEVTVENGQKAATMMALQMENGAISQGIQAAFRCWKWQENEFFLRASRKKCSPAELDFCPVRLCQTSNVPYCNRIKLF